MYHIYRITKNSTQILMAGLSWRDNYFIIKIIKHSSVQKALMTLMVTPTQWQPSLISVTSLADIRFQLILIGLKVS